MLVDSNEVRLLTEIGFLASARGDTRRAQRIFDALERIRPANAAVYVGLALAYLNRGDADEALRVLDRGLLSVAAADVDVFVLHAFRAIAFQFAGRSSERLRALRQAGDCPLALSMQGDLAVVLEGK